MKTPSPYPYLATAIPSGRWGVVLFFLCFAVTGVMAQLRVLPSGHAVIGAVPAEDKEALLINGEGAIRALYLSTPNFAGVVSRMGLRSDHIITSTANQDNLFGLSSYPEHRGKGATYGHGIICLFGGVGPNTVSLPSSRTLITLRVRRRRIPFTAAKCT